MSSAALAFIAGMGGGYLKADEKKRENERQASKDKREQDLHDMQMAEKQRVVDDRVAVQNAGSDAVVKPQMGAPTPEQVATAPVGQPGEIGYQSNTGTSAKFFATQGAAQDDATAQNAPGAKAGRIAALAAQGNALAGTTLTGNMQREAAQMTLDKGHREEANQVFDNGLRTALQTKGPDGMAEFMSTSTADGAGGKLKFKAVTAPDGKTWQIHQVGEDGVTTKPFGQTFKNDTEGYSTAGYMLSRSVPDSDKVKHMLDLKKADSDEAYKAGMLGVSQQNANTQEQWRKDQAQAARERLSAAGGSSGKPGSSPASDFDPLAGFDSKKAQAVAFEQASKEAQESAATGKQMTATEQGMRAQQIFQATADAQANENRNRYVASVASKELRAVASDPVQYAATYQKALAAGLNAPALASLGFKPPAAPQGKNTPAAAAAAGVQPAAPQAATAQAPASKEQQIAAAYDQWQRLKSANNKGYFSQSTPSDATNIQAEKQAEQVYTQLLSNRYSK